MAAMLTIGQALDEMLSAFHPLAAADVPLLSARGLVTATDVIARHDLPGFDNSAMDGYAVRAADVTVADVELPVVGESRAGGPLPSPLTDQAAMRIFTGAPMPAGADAVIMQENAVRDGNRVRFSASPKPGAHVRHRGSDLGAGACAIAVGSIIDAGEIGMLSSQGITSVHAWRRPRVAIVCTGDELRDLGQPLTPGTLYNSNGYALAAAVESVGAEAWLLPIARDDADVIAATLRDAFTSDVVLCCGGVSVGDYDLVAQSLATIGVDTRFHKVAMKPGKPLLFGLRGATPFVGLPGNPVSAWVAFEVFVRPCLRKMLGHARVHPRSISIALGHAHRRSTGRTEFARARFDTTTDPIVATLTTQQGSGSLPSIVNIDGLVILPPETEHFAAGDRLAALVLHEARGQRTSALK